MTIDFRRVSRELDGIRNSLGLLAFVGFVAFVFCIAANTIDGCTANRYKDAELKRLERIARTMEESNYDIVRSLERLNTTLVKANFSKDGKPNVVQTIMFTRNGDPMNVTNFYVTAGE